VEALHQRRFCAATLPEEETLVGIEPASSAKSIMAYQAVLRAKPRITSVLVAVGSGLEISRFD